MKRLKQLLVLTAITVIVSCSGIRVNQDYDMSTIFQKYRTFDLAPDRFQKSGDILMDSPLMDQRIRGAIENTLIFRGYPKTADSRPDFRVEYQLGVRTRIEIDTIPAYGWWGYPCEYRHCYNYPYWGGFGHETYVRQFEEVTLVIDFMDSETNKLFWRGVGSRRLASQLTPEKMTDWINQLVLEILAQYPPLPGGR